MNTVEIKSKLHSYIDRAEQPFLRIVEVMFEQYFKEQEKEEQNDSSQVDVVESIQTIEQSGGSSPNVMDAVTRIRPFVPLDEIVTQQQYQPITYAEFRNIADEIEIEESIEELLGMLTK